MKTEIFNYILPEELIAQHPANRRDGSRLLVLERNTGNITDTSFKDIANFIAPEDMLVLNNTKVLAAKFKAARTTGAGLEALFLNDLGNQQWQVLLKGLRKLKINETFYLLDRHKKNFCTAKLCEKLNNGECIIAIDSKMPAEEILSSIGSAPLPPYIKRDGCDQTDTDKLRYQTVYAKNSGAVAAPTAGLHFTEELIGQLKEKGTKFAEVTLHVGAGTFKPVTSENIEDHKIHSERFSIDKENALVINEAISSGRRIIAVGTTTVRTLESAAQDRGLTEQSNSTRLFITPGFNFKLVNAMITNFHLPGSTLLALTAAFAGLDNILNAYKHAVEQKYRFFSYGDAMLII